MARYQATPANSTDRDHLLGVIKQHTECTNQMARDALDGIIGTITASLKTNKRVQLVGFGTFEVRHRKARKGRNPQTGEEIRIKASKTVGFKPGKALKSSI